METSIVREPPKFVPSGQEEPPKEAGPCDFEIILDDEQKVIIHNLPKETLDEMLESDDQEAFPDNKEISIKKQGPLGKMHPATITLGKLRESYHPEKKPNP
jgi:hypothetical protein